MSKTEAFINNSNIIAMTKANSKNKTVKSSKSQNHTSMSNTNNTTTNSNGKAFSFEPTMANVAELTLHPFLELIGYEVPDELFKERAAYFNFYERSVITEDGYVLTHPKDFLASIESGVEMTEVVVMKGAQVNDIADFVSFKAVHKHGKDRRKLFETAKFLMDYVRGQEKQWRQERGGKKTRAIVADMLGVSDGTVQNILSIGNNSPELLEKIDKKEATSKAVIENFKSVNQPKTIQLSSPEELFESRKRYQNLVISNTPSFSFGEEAEVKVYRAIFETNKGNIEFHMNGQTASMYINGIHYTDVTHNVVSDKDYNGKRDYCQHHTLLSNDDAFDVQFILKGIEKLIANQNDKAA